MATAATAGLVVFAGWGAVSPVLAASATAGASRPVSTTTAETGPRVWDLYTDLAADVLSADPVLPAPDRYGTAGTWALMHADGTERDPDTYRVQTGPFTEPCAPGLYQGEPNGLSFEINTSGDSPNCYIHQVRAPHAVFTHPWRPGSDTVVRWRSPITGTVSVTGAVIDRDAGGGNGVSWFLDQGDRERASGVVPNGGSQELPPDLRLSVTEGAYLYLLVDPNGEWSFDFTQVDLTITEVTPVITWNPPAAIDHPTALGADQLNATANVPGSFTYTVRATGAPARGAVLNPGGGQVLDAVFTPADTARFTTATAHVTIAVRQGTQTVTFAPVPLNRAAQPSFDVTDLATASSGLAVTFTAAGTCRTTPQGHVEVTAAGQCTLTASQPGNGGYRAATPVAQSLMVGAPAEIGLSASATTANAYHQVRITATVGYDVRTVRRSVEIIDGSNRNRVLATCWSGNTCTATVSAPPGAHRYLARLKASGGRVQLASSPELAVTWVVPTVWLVASSTTPATGEAVTLTAFMTDDMTPTPWALQLVETDTGRVVTRCTTGNLCSATTTPSGRHTYQAALVGWRNGAQVVMGTSAPVTVG